MRYCYMDSPVGTLLLGGRDHLSFIEFQKGNAAAEPEPYWVCDPGGFVQAVSQLTEYFDGTRQQFTLTVTLEGTGFQKRVWQEMSLIPYGQTLSYSGLAERIQNPRACRAVGMASARNPLPIVIPCHRVIGKNGSLVGFGGGLSVKQKLLDLEQAVIRVPGASAPEPLLRSR